jgi:N-acetylmuramic acid 6-phosphate (MurNAc-6-P) etherase
MPSYRTGEVVTLLEARPGLQRVEVDLGSGPERAAELLEAAGKDVRTAIVMGRLGINREQARERLAAAGGRIAQALHG